MALSPQDDAPRAAGEGALRVAASPRTVAYFSTLRQGAARCYTVATEARKRGIDPSLEVEIPLAQDLADRVERQVGPPGVAARIRDLTAQALASGRSIAEIREEIALAVAKEVAGGLFGPAADPAAAMEQAIRTGLSILTEGVLVAPLEGLVGVKLWANADGSRYPAVSFAGPIRSAGGTAQALSVLIADVVRQQLGLAHYRPTGEEVERYKEEVAAYRRQVTLQYTPTPEEIALMVTNCPICIDGEGTEQSEVSGYRDLPRVETNKIRGGMVLVLAEGLALKAKKVIKHTSRLQLEGWGFLDQLVTKGKDEPSLAPVAAPAPAAWEEGADPDEVSKEEADDTDVGAAVATTLASPERLEAQRIVEAAAKVKPNSKFLQDIIGGRPVFAAPSTPGGFRLRYGRGRTTGLAGIALHPATMVLLDNFLAVGTQIKIERPGKAGAVTPCDTIEGPIVLLQSGDLVLVDTEAWACKVAPQVKQIVDLGEILIPFGEFLENNHVLVPGAFCPEWWQGLAQSAGLDAAVASAMPSPSTAFDLSERLGLPLHPSYNLFWHDLQVEEIVTLARWVRQRGEFAEGILSLPADPVMAQLLYRLGALHAATPERLVLDRYGLSLMRAAGLDGTGTLVRKVPTPLPRDPLELVSALSGVRILPRGPTRIGARMGRPEKAKERLMKPPLHVLFPLGESGGPQRLVRAAVEAGSISVEVGQRRCEHCNATGYEVRCPTCSGHTTPCGEPIAQRIDMRSRFEQARVRLGEANLPEIKGVRGLMSAQKTPELLEKGLLRAKHGVYTFKDGTVRFDLTDVPLTHFRPREVQISVEEAHALGYAIAIDGSPLTSPEQIVELQVQDIVVSERCGRYLLQIAKFIDDMLERLYGLPPYYTAAREHDLLGTMVVGLAPHTSAGVLGRLVGFTTAQVCYAHPYFHAAKRRNCDGDEDSVLLLLDCLLNFSRSYLPDRRGGLMDAPLVLTAVLDPSEIDKEAHNLDVGPYPVAFFEAAASYHNPKDLLPLMQTVSARLGTEAQYEGFAFSHDTSSLDSGPKLSSYKSLPNMELKVNAQLSLARKIRAVDASAVATGVIEGHFLPDLIGNLRTFNKQTVRCTKCNTSYRRMPLTGKCTCGNSLTLTVHEGSVKKYLEPAKRIMEEYGVATYLRQRVRLIEEEANSIFTSDKVTHTKLDDFL